MSRSIAPVSAANIDYLQSPRPPLGALDSNEELTQAGPRQLFRIEGIGRERKNTPHKYDPKEYSSPFESLLVGMHGFHSTPVAYCLRGQGGSVGLHVGVWMPRGVGAEDSIADRARALTQGLASLYPMVRIEESQVSFAASGHGAFCLGSPTVVPPDPADGAASVDRLIRGMGSASWSCLVLAQPVLTDDVTRIRGSIAEEMRRVQLAEKAGDAPGPLARHYSELLKARLEALTYGMAFGTWRTAVYLQAEGPVLAQLASLWRGLHSGKKSLPESVTAWEHARVAELATDWAMPNTEGQRQDGNRYRRPLEFQTLLTSAELSAYIHLPENECPGFSIESVPAFDSVAPRRKSGPEVSLGAIAVRGQPSATPLHVSLEDLGKHLFVAGITSSGKTNTIFRILEQLHDYETPFLVIEPAKAEYRTLLDHPTIGPDLRVYTPGNENVAPFRINPFRVPDGIPVSVHLDLLRSVFVASFGMWTPLPQILERCLYEIYEDRGWDVTRSTNARIEGESRPVESFPTISDLANKVEDVIQKLGYDERVSNDMRAALSTRVNALRTGGKGRMFDVAAESDFDELMRAPCVFELEGMGDDDDKAFFIGLIWIRLVEHWRVQGRAPSLRHIFVVEEAHRLLSRSGGKAREEESNPRGRAVETFASLLAEIRAYGQGVIVADQVPSKLAPDVIKNTNTKLVHRLVAEDDRKLISGAMAMNDAQSQALTNLPVGRAVAHGRHDDQPIQVQVELSELHESEEPPSNETIAALMAERGAERDSVGFGRSSRDAVAYDAACKSAEDEGFRAAVARLADTAVHGLAAARRLAPSVMANGRHTWPSRIDQSEASECLASRAAEWLAGRRGAQNQWTFSQTRRYGEAIRTLLLGGPGPDEDVWNGLVAELFERRFPPFERCERICAGDTPLCAFRRGVGDNITKHRLNAGWSQAQAAVDQSFERGIDQLWGVCMDAGAALIDFPERKSNEAAGEAGRMAARQVSLCWAQQRIQLDVHYPLPRNAAVLDGLLRRAGLE